MRLYSRNLAAVLMGLALLAFQIDSDAQSRGGSQSSRSSRPSASASSSSSSASRSSAPSSKSSASSSRPSTSASRPSTSASASRPSSSASSQDSKPKADISPANRNPSKPSNNVTRPSSKPSGSVSKPSGNTKPSGNVTKPSGNNKPSGDLNRPSGNHQRPSGSVSRPSGHPQRPSGHRPPGNISGPSRPSGPAPVMKPGLKPHNHWKPSGHYYGHRIKVLPARARCYVYSGRTYYVLDDIWYRLHNGYYVVSRPPVGTVLAANLIADIVWTAVRFANNVVPQASYFYQDGVFYTLGADGRYYVIVPPIGALIERLPDDYEVISIGGNEYYRVDDTIYQLTINDGQPYFEVVGQVD